MVSIDTIVEWRRTPVIDVIADEAFRSPAMDKEQQLSLAAMLLAALVWPSCAAGAEMTLTLDNDFFCGFDRHYTNGIQIAVLGDLASLPRALRSVHPFGSSVDDQFTF